MMGGTVPSTGDNGGTSAGIEGRIVPSAGGNGGASAGTAGCITPPAAGIAGDSVGVGGCIVPSPGGRRGASTGGGGGKVPSAGACPADSSIPPGRDESGSPSPMPVSGYKERKKMERRIETAMSQGSKEVMKMTP